MKRFLMLSVSIVGLCGLAYSQEPTPTPASGTGQGNGISRGVSGGNNIDSAPYNSNAKITPLRVLSKPRAAYTEAARENGDEGSVRLKVSFLASGAIGDVSPVTGLPNGLTEQAVAAAKQMNFEPQTVNGKPVSVTKTVIYDFSIYYGENDPNLKSNAEITEMPTPENPAGELFKNYGGKVFVSLILLKDGRVNVVQINSSLPQEFKEKAFEAAGKIKFKPAVNKNGNEVSQTKDIEYEFKPQNN